jgi:hypothetical protein
MDVKRSFSDVISKVKEIPEDVSAGIDNFIII